MGIVIWIAIIIALVFIWSRIKSGMRSAIRKLPKREPAPGKLAEKEPNTTDTMNISEADLQKSLKQMQMFAKIRGITMPILIAAVLFLAYKYGGIRMSMGEFFVRILLPVAILIVIVGTIRYNLDMRIKKIRALIGNAVTYPVLREVFDIQSYRTSGHIDRKTIASSGLVGGWEDIGGSDFFTGSYRGINIMYSDVKLSHEETRTNDGKETKVTVTDFEGQWLVCDFGKELSASVRLIERKGDSGGAYVIDMIKSDIETENIEFNKKYRIMTEDGHAAFYLLTPHFMERLMAADELAKATTRFYFGDGKAHIALGSGYDFFELGNAKLKNIDSVRQKFRREIKRLTDIVDELLSNDKLFKEA